MRIGINTLFLIPGGVGGSEVYLRNLVKHLERIDQSNQYVLFTNVENSNTFALEGDNFREVLCPIRATFRPSRILWEQAILPLQVKRHHIDVLHSPGYTAPAMTPSRCVVTIHDMNYFYYLEDFSKLAVLALKILVPLSARRADKVIAVSRNSMKDIVRALGISQERVCVIYEASDRDLALSEPFAQGRASSAHDTSVA